MSLLKPTPGEVMDRLSILNLKINAYDVKNLNSGALIHEALGLSSLLDEMGSKPDEIESLSESLSTINNSLWLCEDEIRSTDEYIKVALTAKRISRLNDDRNIVIRQINKAYGLEPGEVKVYS